MAFLVLSALDCSRQMNGHVCGHSGAATKAGGRMARYLFLVSRHHPRLYEYLIERFHDDPNVAVVLDRRSGERRARVQSVPAERRVGDRRRRRSPAADLNMW